MKKYVIVLALIFFITFIKSCEKKEYAPNEIPLINHDKLYMIELTINNKKGRFLLDTGANSSYINYNDLDKFKISVSNNTSINLSGLGGKGGDVYEVYDFKMYKKDGVKLPSNVVFKTTELKINNLYINGIIGADYLHKNKGVIDYENNILTIKM